MCEFGGEGVVTGRWEGGGIRGDTQSIYQRQETRVGKSVIGRGKPLIVGMCATLVYYHCAYRNSSIVSLLSDVFIVLLCSLAILGLLFRQMNIQVPVDPLEWQISQDTANSLFACLANTVGAAESVLRVAATGHDKRLFLKVVVILYMLSALGRLVSGVTVAYSGLSLFCLYILAENSSLFGTCSSKFCWRRDSPNDVLDNT